MELLVWHEALGCDDEQASEAELLARVLYAYSTGVGGAQTSANSSSDGDRARLKTMHFVQGLLAFVRMLKRPVEHDERCAATGSTDSAAHERLEWVSVTLSRRRFFIQEVEPQIYIALGIAQEAELREHRFVYRAVLRDLYGMFCLFHGQIDSNLRWLPRATTSAFADGMELLLAIQAARKRIRKLELLLDACEHESDCVGADASSSDSPARRIASDCAQAQTELEALLERSPATRLEKRLASFVPTLLHALDAFHATSLHDLVGMEQILLAPPAFLSLQSFLNAFRLELSGPNGVVAASALFFKGRVVSSSIETPMLELLYRFLRLREEHGMEAASAGPTVSRSSATPLAPSVWMPEQYRETFQPIWSSKTSYTECAVVTHARRHPRKAVRSLHRQTPLPLAAVVSDANGPPHASSTSKTLSTSALKARLKSVAYRNTGLLMRNGYFAKTFELPIQSRGRGKFSEREAVEFIWKPRIYDVGPHGSDDGAVGKSSERPEAVRAPQRYAVLWHEADLSMLVLVNDDDDADSASAEASDDDAAATRVLETLACIEDAMDRLKFYDLAKLLLHQSAPSASSSLVSSSSTPSTAATARSSSSATYPFVYLNRADATFRSLQLPRLVKRKEHDAYPLPLRLLAHYLPQPTLDLLNALHAELQKCGPGETRDVCVKTLHDGWLLAKKSEVTQREFYAFFDTKVPSVSDLSDALEDLLQDQFGNVFF